MAGRGLPYEIADPPPPIPHPPIRSRAMRPIPTRPAALALACLAIFAGAAPEEPTGATRSYENRLTPIADPKPILADHPQYVAPIEETARFEAPTLVDDPGADLDVRA